VIHINAEHSWFVTANLSIRPSTVLPRESKHLTKTGKVSVKEISASKFNETYEAHVASCACRVARELAALLPVEFVLFNALTPMVDPATGHLQDTVILSVAFAKKTLATLNFDQVDCVAALKNFVHNIKFKKTEGFGPVERVGVSALKRD
jgi:hypothetical protein